MKYTNNFKIQNKTESYFLLKDGSTNIRLDFFKNVFRVSIYKNEDDLFSTFKVNKANKEVPYNGFNKLSTDGFELIKPIFDITDNCINATINNIRIEIELKNFNIKYFIDNKLLFKDRNYAAYNFDNEFGKGSFHYLSREDDEIILGLGDKSGLINKSHELYKLDALDSMGYDARKSDPLYKHVPFYICKNSVGSYGIYYDTLSMGEFNFGKEHSNYYELFKSFKCEEDSLVYYVFFGDIMNILKEYSSLTGSIFMPPKWSLKYNGSTMAYTDSPNSEKELKNFMKLCKEYEIEPGGFYLSSGYTSYKDKRYVFNWNKDKIKDPESFAKEMKDQGLEFLPNIKPAFLIDHPLYDFIKDNGWFLHYKDGSPAIFPFWGDYASLLDFTNKGAYDFWVKCAKENLIDLGYKNLWNDNNEYEVYDFDVYANGFGKEIQARLIRPVFPFLMTKASLDANKNRPWNVSRFFSSGMERIATTWTGDNRTSFLDFRYNHKIAMTMSLSGIYNFGQDIGGFALDKPNKELFIKWIKYGIFTPRFVLHSWNTDGSSNMPWLYPELKKQVMKLFKLRESLIPYLYNELYRSVTKFEPIIYPVYLKDDSYDLESDFFYFGNSILVCPIFDEGVFEIDVNLPYNNGGWYNKNHHYTGINKFSSNDDEDPIYFIKGGSVIPTNNEFIVYPMDDGEFSYNYLLDDGLTPLNKQIIDFIDFYIECKKDEIIISLNKDVSIKVIDHLNRRIVINKR